MDPITLSLLVSGGAALVGPLIADALSQGDRNKAEALRQEAMKQFNIQLPDVETIALQPERIQSLASQAQGSAEAQQMRMEALRQLSQRAAEGFNIEDRAAINAALADVSAQERGSREALLRKLPAQSGAQVAALLANQQAAAQQANQMGLDIAAQGRRQALQAIAGKGQLAGAIDEATFGQAFQRGQAADIIAKFNAANQMEAQNVNEQRRLQQANLANQLKMQQAMGRAGALSNLASLREQEAQRIRQGVGGTAQGVSTAAGAYAAQQAYESDPYVKLRKKKQQEELAKMGGSY